MINFLKKRSAAFLTTPVIGALLISGLGEGVFASAGTEVFRGFTSHISEQIRRDKQDFFEAQTCTSWFYNQMGKKPQAGNSQPENISFQFSSQPEDKYGCANRYPGGVEGLHAAREDFSNTQRSLSFSLTFYEAALVGDRDDDGQYNGGELKDLFESLGLSFEDQLPSDQYLVSLKGKFENLRDTKELLPLVRSMESLLEKGYRFTSADQEALNRELE